MQNAIVIMVLLVHTVKQIAAHQILVKIQEVVFVFLVVTHAIVLLVLLEQTVKLMLVLQVPVKIQEVVIQLSVVQVIHALVLMAILEITVKLMLAHQTFVKMVELVKELTPEIYINVVVLLVFLAQTVKTMLVHQTVVKMGAPVFVLRLTPAKVFLVHAIKVGKEQLVKLMFAIPIHVKMVVPALLSILQQALPVPVGLAILVTPVHSQVQITQITQIIQILPQLTLQMAIQQIFS